MEALVTEHVSPLDRLVVLRATLDDTVVGDLRDVLATRPDDAVWRTRAYAQLAFRVFADDEASLRSSVLSALLADRNAFTEALRSGREPSRSLRRALESDLRNVEMACDVSVADLKGEVPDAHMLPDIDLGERISFVAAYYRNLRIEKESPVSAEGTEAVDAAPKDTAKERLVRWLKN